MNRWLGICLLCALLIVPWTGQAETWRESFQSQVKQWAEELALQDQRFAPFAQASIRHEGLGPNTKQWLVTFFNEHQKVGYMVVGEDPSGFVLLEYGLGEYTLFDEETMKQLQSSQSDMSKHYAALESVWLDKSRIFDGKSGEKYPVEAGLTETELASSVRKEAVLETSFHQEALPFKEGWLKPGEIIQEEMDLVTEIAQGEVSFIARLFQNTVTAPFKVLGYHQWGEQLFVELDDYGSRYIPFRYAVQVGEFYQ